MTPAERVIAAARELYASTHGGRLPSRAALQRLAVDLAALDEAERAVESSMAAKNGWRAGGALDAEQAGPAPGTVRVTFDLPAYVTDDDGEPDLWAENAGHSTAPAPVAAGEPSDGEPSGPELVTLYEQASARAAQTGDPYDGRPRRAGALAVYRRGVADGERRGRESERAAFKPAGIRASRRAAAKLVRCLWSMWLCDGYRIDPCGPSGLVLDALDEVAPGVAERAREARSGEDLGDVLREFGLAEGRGEHVEGGERG